MVLPDEAIVKVVELVAAQNPGVSVLATRLLARCCQTGHQVKHIATKLCDPFDELCSVHLNPSFFPFTFVWGYVPPESAGYVIMYCNDDVVFGAASSELTLRCF